MRSAAFISLAFALFSAAPLASAETPMPTFTLPKISSITVNIRHIRHPQTPSWIGEYKNEWLTIDATISSTPSCREAEGNPLKLISLQRVGTCAVKKTSTRINW